MERDEDGIKQVPTAGRCSLKRKRGAGASGGFLLVDPAAVSVARSPAPAALPHDSPFMSNMDEISYWVYTKRAPCLYNYDNIIKKQVEQAQCSTAKPPSIKTKDEEPSPKKRKLKLLKDDSISTEKPQKIVLKTPKQKLSLSTSKSESDADSDIDFDIKMPATKKVRKVKSQKQCLTRVHKKNKIVTSTPNITILRRSLRKTPQIFNDGNCNIAYDIINANVVNGKPSLVENKAEGKDNKVPHNQSKVMLSGKEAKVLNGQLEDSSDVSGFTANYIRSTKIHSSKRPQKLRNQNSRALTKQSKQRVRADKMIICLNKSINPDLPEDGALNCSSDSSQNALKLVTVKHNEQSSQVNKSSSLLKLIETKLEDCNSNSKMNKQESKSKLNISFQSRSSAASRYPRRHKNNKDIPEPNCSIKINTSKGNTSREKYNMRKGAAYVNRDEEERVSRARSGRRKSVKLYVKETNPVVQLNSSTEQVSSSPALNNASSNTKSLMKNSASSRCLRSRTAQNKVGQFYKESSSEGSHKRLSDSAKELTKPNYARKITKNQDRTGQSDRSRDLRNKSGFAACFSDSDSDCVPLKQNKFFC